MDHNLAKSSGYLITKGYRGAANVSKLRPGSARMEDFRRIGIGCRSALLGGGLLGGRPDIITRRGAGGMIRLSRN
ncbi:hypothetical protein IAE29_03210 [Ochrobactrum sp. S46]|nr:hypothetical protein [Ochrobactrum sp. S45]MBK0042328.1 hypothetical protein [Ochrobactrum sp. S46]